MGADVLLCPPEAQRATGVDFIGVFTQMQKTDRAARFSWLLLDPHALAKLSSAVAWRCDVRLRIFQL
jgi:hypothetical protein